jgi:hypothetical protein
LSSRTRNLLLVTVLIVVISLLISVSSCYTVSEKLSSKLQNLVEAYRRGEAEEYAEQHGIELVDGSVRVSVKCDPDMIEEATEAARALGIVELEAIVSEDIVYPYLEVLIPIVKLNALAREKSIIRVELPGRVYPQGQ